MKLSVILLIYNSKSYIKECLDSLQDSLQGYRSEIIVVDNGSIDGSDEILKEYGDKINILRQTENLGVAKGRNIGIEHTSGEYILFLDIDTKVNKNALETMIEYLGKNPECGLCGCKLTDQSGDIQKSCRRYPTLSYKIANVISEKCYGNKYITSIKRITEKASSSQFYDKEINAGKPFEAEYLIGACQMFKREIIKKVGLLDEKIFYGPEDADFCRRIWNAGYKVVYIPSAAIIHHYKRATARKLISRLTLRHIAGLIRFWTK